MRGVGVWTAAEVSQRALGDPDAVSFGDYHVAKNLTWALTGEVLGDAEMAELLEPYRGHRYRVQHLLELSAGQRGLGDPVGDVWACGRLPRRSLPRRAACRRLPGGRLGRRGVRLRRRGRGRRGRLLCARRAGQGVGARSATQHEGGAEHGGTQLLSGGFHGAVAPRI